MTEVRNARIIVSLPDADWEREVAKSAGLRTRETPEQAARGRILGEAMHMLRYRAEARRGWNGPAEEDVIDCALHLMEIDSYGHDNRALKRVIRGLPVSASTRAAPLAGRMGYYKDKARAGIEAAHAQRRAYCRAYGQLPDGWTITVVGSLPRGHESETYVSDEAW